MHASYDADCGATGSGACCSRRNEVFAHFRTGFLGKASPVHFFWGRFDLAVTRFSGRARAAPSRRRAASAAMPWRRRPIRTKCRARASGRAAAPIDYAGVLFLRLSGAGGICRGAGDAGCRASLRARRIYPAYDAVRKARDPDAALMEFLQSTYDAAADLANGTAALECEEGKPGVPRRIR